MKLAKLILLGGSLLFFLLSFVVEAKEAAGILRILGFATLVASVLGMIFPEKFGNKSTREEIEKKNFPDQYK